MPAEVTVAAHKAALKDRYVTLRQRAADIRAKSAPLREQRDALVAEFQPREREMNDAIKAAETGLYEADQEAAEIAKLLGHETPAAG